MCIVTWISGRKYWITGSRKVESLGYIGGQTNCNFRSKTVSKTFTNVFDTSFDTKLIRLYALSSPKQYR